MTDVVNDPHPFEEDPEQHLGDVTKDPWDDVDQTDWPQAGEDEPDVSDSTQEEVS